jgi:D-methionine transport system ATP-binding protein
MTAPLINITRASKKFALPDGGAFDAVRDVSLSIGKGDIFGLIGKSGAGKSTLLRLINLLERPDHGMIEVDGRELTSLNKRDLRDARRNIGMIFQQFNLLQNATVSDNVAFPLRIHGGLTAQQIAARIYECLELVELSGKSASYPAQLSGGQKQRVAIARALASRPAVLLCDEPTSALDAETTRALLSTLRDINHRLGVTIVIVSHELSVIGEICNRVAVVENGEIAEQFALDDASSLAIPRKTALGRELAQHGRATLGVLNAAPRIFHSSQESAHV